MTAAVDSLKTRRTLKVGNRRFDYFSLKAAEKNGLGDLSRLPFSLKILLENLLRAEDGRSVRLADIKAIAAWLKTKRSDREIAYRPARVLMQDFTGVPAVVDLAAMRDAMRAMGEDPRKINPLSAVDLVIDHSVMVDSFGNRGSFAENVTREYERNGERYSFLRWGQTGFANFRVVPPGTGICHQVNLEYLSQVVWTAKDGDKTVAYLQQQIDQQNFMFPTMLDVVSAYTHNLRRVEMEDRNYIERADISFNLHTIIGGIMEGDSEPRAFLVYPQGNWIEVEEMTPYLTIGSVSYGKPILDRTLRYDTDLRTAIKVAYLSFDSTKFSSSDVGFPIDLITMTFPERAWREEHLENDDVRELREWWNTHIKDLVTQAPDAPWMATLAP